ncbi:MAG: peptidoglycan bridge formation glycyltransferase FemA/FemB family protein [Spirochaetaceae bacterium]|nr:peptidoglycan bridge formation glycyltransferase FemA/FemB family protein [Spirochaetaceae bacterium]
MEFFLAGRDQIPAALLEHSPSHFLQSDFWASFKEAQGWKAIRVYGHYNPRQYLPDWTGAEELGFSCSILTRSFSLPLVGKFSLAYVPMGVELGDSPEILADAMVYGRLLSDFSDSLRVFLDKRTICLRFDVPVDLPSLEERSRYRRDIPCRLAPDNIQPPDTVLVDLAAQPEEILSRMKSKWRYNIRLAEKKGVEVRRCGAEAIDVFYSLYETTSRRDGIAIHHKDYYHDLLLHSSGAESNGSASVSLYVASYQGEPLAAIITLFAGREAVYLYGASSNSHRNLMPAYLLQWRAMQDAKAAGCLVYDLYGIPPTDAPGHPMHGLYRFKTGFGGQNIHRPGSVDIPLSPVYHGYVLGERLRNFWYKRVKKLLAGR